MGIVPVGRHMMHWPVSYTHLDVYKRQAYKRVKANRGSAGVDGESIAAFEQDLKNNLY